MPIPALLGLLSAAPQILGAVGGIVSAVTGGDPPAAARASPEAMAEHIAALPPEQQVEIRVRVMDHIEAMERETTARWSARLGFEAAADVEKLRATARPQIALQAMAVIRVFGIVLIWAAAALSVEWLVRVGFAVWGCSETAGPNGAVIEVCRTMPAELSVGYMLAQLGPVTAMIWPPLLASLAACVAVIKAYMGARERDKARADEMTHGKPLDSTAATVAAAGGSIANLIRAFRKT